MSVTIDGVTPGVEVDGTGAVVNVTVTTGSGGGGGGVTDHGLLTGLADDDHPQYALADGSRGSFATTAQGALADSAVQPGDLGGAATLNVGTTAGTVAAGDDPRLTDARPPTAHTHSGADITTGTVAPERLGSGTPSSSNFLRGDGSWQALPAPTGTVVVRKPANESVANSDTLQADDHLTFWIGANETWVFSIEGLVDAPAARDIKVGIAVPTGATLSANVLGALTGIAANPAPQQFHARLTASSDSVALGAIGAGLATRFAILGSVANGSTAGSVGLQWAQNSSGGFETIVLAGSYLVAQRTT
jgi:hypothetical protein